MNAPIPPTLDSVTSEIKEWRQNKKNSRERVPEHIWKSAEKLCSTHPISQVTSAMGINHTALKNRILPKSKKKSQPSAQLNFIEVPLSSPQTDTTTCKKIVIERNDGHRMMIIPNDHGLFDLGVMIQGFLGYHAATHCTK